MKKFMFGVAVGSFLTVMGILVMDEYDQQQKALHYEERDR